MSDPFEEAEAVEPKWKTIAIDKLARVNGISMKRARAMYYDFEYMDQYLFDADNDWSPDK
jgi:hypothetical protein